MLTLILSMVLIMIIKNKYTKSVMCMIFLVFNLNLQSMNLSKMSYLMGGDLLSFWITNLSMWIIMLIMMIKMNSMDKYMKMMILLMMILLMTFYTLNFMIFFILFEMSMIVIIITVMSWGYQPERVEATMFMLIMTSVFSLPFFISLMNNFNHLNFWFLNLPMTIWDYLSFMLIFMVKMPAFFIHMWLPKVHVESPVHGSMILAAIMLKLGCYGMIRMTPMIMKVMINYSFIIVVFSLWSMTILSLVCTIQPDLKSMIAYSSIVHMMLTLAGISLNKTKSMMASLIIMLGHGMCSSALFFLCNQMYKNTKSRSTIINKSVSSSIPTMTSMWFFLCMLNAPMPPSINMLSEIMSFKIMMSWSTISMVMVFLVMLFSCFYSILLFCIPTHGTISKLKYNAAMLNSKSMLLIMMHILPTIMMISKSSMMMIN